MGFSGGELEGEGGVERGWSTGEWVEQADWGGVNGPTGLVSVVINGLGWIRYLNGAVLLGYCSTTQ